MSRGVRDLTAKLNALLHQRGEITQLKRELSKKIHATRMALSRAQQAPGLDEQVEAFFDDVFGPEENE